MQNPEKITDLLKEEDEIRKIIDILINSEAVKSIPEPLEPTLYADNRPYQIFPANHRVIVDYKKLARALYYAGYRKIEERDKK